MKLFLIINSIFIFCACSSVKKVSDNSGLQRGLAAACVDPDGDGYGWNGTETCIPSTGSTAAPASNNVNNNTSSSASGACLDPDGDGYGWNGTSSCDPNTGSTSTQSTNNSNNNSSSASGACLDPDGDGYGWNGTSSCDPNTGSTSTQSSNNTNNNTSSSTSGACLDPDGDGYGWNGTSSCDPNAGSTSTQNNNNSNNNCAALNSGRPITELVTDVILTAGQSNAAGNNTNYNPGGNNKDRVNSRFIVWTNKNRWEIANPSAAPNGQVWHGKPGKGYFPAPPGTSRRHNHPGFQIGRAIVNSDSCRVVALIATSAPGMNINHWLNNVEGHFYNDIEDTVNRALNGLPLKNKVDMIWWMQGEADNDPNIDYYFGKLKRLISMFRSRSWFDNQKYFLANETRGSNNANIAIRKLRTDGDPYSDYSRGEHKSNDQFPYISHERTTVHFNEVSLRKIGDLTAQKYLRDYLGK